MVDTEMQSSEKDYGQLEWLQPLPADSAFSPRKPSMGDVVEESGSLGIYFQQRRLERLAGHFSEGLSITSIPENKPVQVDTSPGSYE